MSDHSNPETLKLCLVSDDKIVESAIQVSFPPPHEIAVISGHHIVGVTHTLSDHGREIVQAAREADVLLVDWNFERSPDLNTLCFQVRRAVSTPIIALVRGSYEEHIAAIAAGADDAVAFPVYASWLQAKVVSYHRLVQAVRVTYNDRDGVAVTTAGDRDPNRAGLRFGELYLDRASHRFYIKDDEVEVTPREFALLAYLIENANSACTRDDILDRVWGINFDTGTNMVDVYMYFLRRKLEAHGLKGMIQTVRGYGYRMVLPEVSTTPE